MARVPVYEGPQVDLAQGPNVAFDAPEAADTSKPLSNLSEGARRLATVGAKVYKDKVDEIDNTRVLEAATELERERIRLSYDPQAGFSHVRGKAAIEPDEEQTLPQIYGAKFNEAANKLENALANDRQRQLFREKAMALGRTLYGDVNRHVASEYTEHRKTILTGQIDTATNAAALEYLVDGRVAEHRASAKAAIDQLLQVNGITDDAAKQDLTVKGLSPLHTNVVAARVQSGQLDAAKTYLEKYGAEMTPEARRQMTAAIKQGDKSARVYSAADELWQGKSFEDAMDGARKLDPEIRGDVEARLRQWNSDQRTAELQQEKQRVDKAWEIVVRDRSTDNIPAGFMGEDGMLDGQVQRQIHDWLQAEANQRERLANGTFKSDWSVYYGLRRMAMDPETRLAFAGLDLEKSKPYLHETDWKRLVEIQSGISKSDAKAMEQQRVVKKTLGQVRSEAAQAGIDLTPSEKDPKAAEKTTEFLSRLTMELDNAMSAKQGPLTDEESARIGRNLLREYIEQGSGFGGFFQDRSLGYEIPAGQEERFIVAPYDDIPPNRRAEIEAALKARNQIARPEIVERIYTRALRNGVRFESE